MKIVQDMPPSGGYSSFSVERVVRGSSVPNSLLFAASAVAILGGLYKLGQGNIQRRAVADEKRAAKKAILPLLQAESDASFVRATAEANEKEAEIMKNVPGWEVGKSVYNTKWMPPTHHRPLI
eukprot:TRINITY_DN1261_c0_g3_i1.p1 TRINITY_DN1261_c0_g3~~TRINITY_DN1261_c0_g3_i1.p1  ORF type:complete len:123 (+),score=35.70 TRINITY_DN1261_c0_g3_i1:61-429(+)